MSKAAGNSGKKKKSISQEDVLDELAKIAFSDDFAKDKMKALEMIGKHLGMFKEKNDSGEDQISLAEAIEEAYKQRTMNKEQ